VQKWGNSLGIRIPKALATEAHINQGVDVDISVKDGRLVVEPVAVPQWSLEELLEGITDENLHEEVDWGPPVGKEVW
jgi:antitoxin MazE